MLFGLRIGGRRNGRTTAMIRWLQEDPDVRSIWCGTEELAAKLRERYGLTENQCFYPAPPPIWQRYEYHHIQPDIWMVF